MNGITLPVSEIVVVYACMCTQQICTYLVELPILTGIISTECTEATLEMN